MSFKFTDFGTNRKLIYDVLLVINTNLPPILHCLGDTAFQMPKIAILATPLAFETPDGGVPLMGRSKLSNIFRGCQRMAKVPNGEEKLRKISTG